jgi:hypothetical protein
VAWVLRGLNGIENASLFATSLVVGQVALVAFVGYVAFLMLRGKPVRAAQLVPVGMMALPIAGGLIVSVNRLPAAAVSERFLSWSTPFWAGAVCALLRSWGRSTAAGWCALLFVVALSTAMLPALDTAWRRQRHSAYRLDVESAMHQTDVRWDGFGRIMVKPGQVYPVVARMRQDRRGVFADRRAALWGMPLKDHFALAPAAQCNASLSQPRQVPSGDTSAAMLLGYVWGGEDRRPEFAVFADRDGVLCGLGAVALDPLRKPAPNLPIGVPAREWSGFLNPLGHPPPYEIFLVLPGEREVCRVATWSGRF